MAYSARPQDSSPECGGRPSWATGGTQRYTYVYASGRKGDFLATGFSPRAREFSIYVLPGYNDFGPILDRLGPHRKGKSCLYVTRLDRIDTGVLADLIRAGLADLATRWPVHPE